MGLVQIFDSPIDPVLASMAGPSVPQSSLPPDFFRLWAKHFAPATNTPTVNVPPEWAAFFTAAMLNPGTFEWVKCFLSSLVWSLFANEKPPVHPDVKFILPKTCPVPSSSTCISSNGEAAISLVENAISAEFQENDDLDDENNDQSIRIHDTTPCLSPTDDDYLENVSSSTGPWTASLLAKADKLKLVEDDPLLRTSSRQQAQK